MTATMTKSRLNPAKTISRAFDTGIPFLRLLTDTPSALTICRRTLGETIDDPDCHELYRALNSGIYCRHRTTSAGKPDGWVWMFACTTDDLERWLTYHVVRDHPTASDEICVDAAWQAMQHRNAAAAAAGRLRSMLPVT